MCMIVILLTILYGIKKKCGRLFCFLIGLYLYSFRRHIFWKKIEIVSFCQTEIDAKLKGLLYSWKLVKVRCSSKWSRYKFLGNKHHFSDINIYGSKIKRNFAYRLYALDKHNQIGNCIRLSPQVNKSDNESDRIP